MQQYSAHILVSKTIGLPSGKLIEKVFDLLVCNF